MSCVVRFTFENNALELPLFISSCRVASGYDLVRFFDKLIERNAPLDKLVSISTDGAANMIGRFNGMTKQFTLLLEQYSRDHQSESRLINYIWCFAQMFQAMYGSNRLSCTSATAHLHRAFVVGIHQFSL